MGELLKYESGLDRAEAVRARRRTAAKWIFIVVSVGGGAIFFLLLIAAAVFRHVMEQQDRAHIEATVTNASSLPVTDLGFQNCFNTREVSLGAFGAGETRKVSIDYNINDCLEDMSFDQARRTFYSKLDGAFDGGRSSFVFTLTIGPNQTVTAAYDTRAGTTRHIQPASMQPLVYLDQNSKPIPVIR